MSYMWQISGGCEVKLLGLIIPLIIALGVFIGAARRIEKMERGNDES